MNTAISTILPTYNRAHLLRRAITSVLNQVTELDELIVVDDGSTDNTKEIVSEYGSRIQYIKTSRLGAGAARNIGIQNAKNPLIAFIDSDDEWLPGKIDIQRSFMAANKNVLYCFTNFSFKETSELGGRYKHFNLISWSKDNRSWEDILGPSKSLTSLLILPVGMDDISYYVGSMCKQELCANYINVNTLIVRRIEAGDALRFAEDTPTYEDWECFGRLACSGLGSYLDFETACQHSHGGNRLTDAHETECARARVTIIPRVWGKNKNFLRENEKLYNKVLDHELLTLIDGLLVRGETSTAKSEIKKLACRPSVFRYILAMLPGCITKLILDMRRLVKGYTHSLRRR